jgi:hypothetical protein
MEIWRCQVQTTRIPSSSKLVEETSVETAGLPPDQQALFDDLVPFRDKGSLKRETRERMGHSVLKIDEIF